MWTAKPALAETSEPILRLELGTHNASIFGLVSDPSNRILVTGSEDKTVRVWEILGDARLLRVLRPVVGEGIRGKADYSASGRITVNMLDLYVSERVKELTQGEQTPNTVKPPNVPDFAVVLVK